MNTLDGGEIDLDLEKHLRLERCGERLFRAQLPEGWQQGRGTFGGIVMGLLARAVEPEGAQEGRSLRSLTGEVNAPVLPGPAEITVEPIRAGSRVTSLAVTLRQDGQVCAHASASFGSLRVPDRESRPLEPPHPPPWQDVEELSVEPPFGPAFGRAFEFRPLGNLPFSGISSAVADGYIRARKTLSSFGVVENVVYADCYWPTLMVLEKAPRPMATLSFTFQSCLDPATVDPGLPLFHRARLLSSHDGYAHELRELWTTDGRLVSLNPQTIVIVR